MLGLPSLKEMELITFHCDVIKKKCKTNVNNVNVKDVNDLKVQYPNAFDGIGNFPGEYHIQMKENTQPVIRAPK